MTAWQVVRAKPEAAWCDGAPEASADGSLLHVILRAPSPVNALTPAVLRELEALFDDLHATTGVDALFLWSGRSDHFIAGADLEAIAAVDEAREGAELAALGQRLIDGWAHLPFPTFAVIQGTCLGGGLELALAFEYRLAVDHPSTRLGLPEVRLGIIPGFGGTQRLPRLIGMRKALPLILSGKRLPARAAYRLGLVDAVLPPEGVPALAWRAAQNLLHRSPRARRRARRLRRGPWWSRLLEALSPGRRFVARLARRQVLAQTGGHYPAPLAAIEAVELGLGERLEDGLAREARACGVLVASPVAKNLMAVFRDSERARRLTVPGAETERFPEAGFVGVLGAGVMGSGLATLLLENGHAVRLRDIQDEALARGLAGIGERIAKDGRRRSPRERDALLARLTHGTGARGFGAADAVIEAVVERLDVKQAALRELEPHLAPGAVFATNTSALSVTRLQEAAQRPERVVGLHFFNPVHRMPLVEVIAGESTAPWATARAVSLAQRLGKFPVIVRDSPGFLVNRLLSFHLNAASLLLERGVPGPAIDAAMESFGLPMGPFRLLDEVGLDIAAEVAGTLYAALGERARPAAVLQRMLEQGRMGRKGGLGFYRYAQGQKGEWAHSSSSAKVSELSAPELVAELIDPMIDEAARCLMEEVVEQPCDVDLAMVMGTGFPPFRGGLLRHADAEGLPALVTRLSRRAEQGRGPEPAGLLQQLVRDGRGFHDLERQGAHLVSRQAQAT